MSSNCVKVVTACPFRLDGQVALITGGGSGIGRATALLLAAHGGRIGITELPGRALRAEEVVGEVRSAGGEAMALSLDVTATLTIEDAMESVVERFGRLDVLVNNAGIQMLKPALEVEEAEFDEVLSVNLKGPFLCARAAARIMAHRGGGCIVNVASQHGVVGNHDRAAYSASKGGLISLTRSLAVEWASYRIRVNSISPTFVRTENNGPILGTDALQAEIRRRILTGRPASCEEVAAGILYLCSPAAQMVTGHNLLMDGGWTAH